ncbi:MAG: DUF3786 domain-containing protein [Methanosarcinaceae archaeon]
MKKQITGEEQAWNILKKLDPIEVCIRAQTAFDKMSDQYILKSFGFEIFISLKDQTISTHSTAGELLLNRLGYFSKLSIPWYLITAKNIPFSNELVRPTSMPGGQMYLTGSHVLPLEGIIKKYDGDIGEFIKRCKKLGGKPASHGDASLQLFPFPRVPVTLILWEHDNEFPARADILFDSTCKSHLPIDMIWSTAMMSLLMMLS